MRLCCAETGCSSVFGTYSGFKKHLGVMEMGFLLMSMTRMELGRRMSHSSVDGIILRLRVQNLTTVKVKYSQWRALLLVKLI